ncbi:MAG: DUF362 domain-containing protein [Anaerolineae bacterium]
MSKRRTVALSRWTQFKDLGRVLRNCLAHLGGMEEFVRQGQTVVIKPNLTADAPAESGGTTHVELVKEIITHVQRCHPGHIIVAEGTGRFGTRHETAFPTGGWRDMAARTGVELYNLDAGPHTEIEPEDPYYPHPIPFSKLILDADVFISVPCLKTHVSADYTVALKNSFALTPQHNRSEIHRQHLLEEALTDLNRIRIPDLTIVDGWDGAEGIAGGVDFDHPAGARLMLAGPDAVAVDLVSRELMDIHAPTRYLNWCIDKGLGIGDLQAVEVRGDPLEICVHPFMSPAQQLMDAIAALDVCDQHACSGCRVAALSAVSRFRRQKLLKPLSLVFGGQGALPSLLSKPLLVGDCAQCYQDGEHPHIIKGCPASASEIIETLKAKGFICQECRKVAQRALDDVSAPFVQHLRITVAGDEMFKGKEVIRGTWHQELLIGDCMAHYAQAVRERASQFDMDPQRDVLWLQGCPVGEDAVEAALSTLQERQVLCTTES